MTSKIISKDVSEGKTAEYYYYASTTLKIECVSEQRSEFLIKMHFEKKTYVTLNNPDLIEFKRS
jgi:hypothetical protein